MSSEPKTGRGSVQDWDAYWRNARNVASYQDACPQDPALEQFWKNLFGHVLPAFAPGARMVDIACGGGMVLRYALAAAKAAERDVELYGLDHAHAALVELRKRHADIPCVAADAARMPYPDGTFDLVTSQFGVEYAGMGGFGEAARLVRPGGTFAALVHLHDGGIYRECSVNLEAADVFRDNALLSRFAELQKRRGTGTEQLHGADREFAASVAACEEVFRRWGKEIASGLLFRLYSDVGQMYRRLNAYDPGEVCGWIDLMAKELDNYRGRMAAMLACALDEARCVEAVGKLADAGLELRRHETLNIGRPAAPAAWAIIADRRV